MTDIVPYLEKVIDRLVKKAQEPTHATLARIERLLEQVVKSHPTVAAKSKLTDSADLIDSKTAARILGISPKTLEGWRAGRGEDSGPPYYKVHNKIKYIRTEVIAYRDSKRVSPRFKKLSEVWHKCSLPELQPKYQETLTFLTRVNINPEFW